MPFDLNRTIKWTTALAAKTHEDAKDLAFLVDLQGNILKGHGRRHTANMFLRFNDAAAGKSLLASLAADLPSALDQLHKTQVHKISGSDGGLFLAAFLSAEGYRSLGLQAFMPPDPAFAAGMGARAGLLNDPPQGSWEPIFAQRVHCMLLIGADDLGDQVSPGTARDAALSEMRGRVGAFGTKITIVGEQLGDALFNKEDGNGIEHFGYVDGRSQPLMLDEDLEAEPADHWNPKINLSQVLVADPGGRLEVSCGSYFVFRKLEQDVKGFKTKEKALAATVGMVGDDDERAGASVVGRFENGTPVILSHVEIPLGTNKTVLNDFNYDSDPAGLKCPFAGHIRKTNPREPFTKQHLMARRGIPFGVRSDDPNDGRLDNKPEGGVGLLFMAYQSNFVDQFEFTQRQWANNVNFSFEGVQPVGLDPVIGQGAPADFVQRYPTTWGKAPLSDPQDFGGFVQMRGGEYFFAPSISFLKNLAN